VNVLKGSYRTVAFGIIIIGITLVISVSLGWIPLNISNSSDNQKINGSQPSEGTSLPQQSLLPELFEQYNINYYWDNTSPVLLLTIEGQPHDFMLVFSDPDGDTVWEEKISKSHLLDKKEVIEIPFDNIPFKPGKYTLILYDPTADKILYAESFKLFDEKLRVFIEDIWKDIQPEHDDIYKVSYYFNVTNRGSTPVMVKPSIELVTPEGRESQQINCTYIAPRKTLIIKIPYDVYYHYQPGFKIEVDVTITLHDCYTGEQLDKSEWRMVIEG